jgi:cold shock CspA family protein
VREPEPDRQQRRGPIVDPKRRPGPDELPVRAPRAGRAGVASGTISKLARDYGFIRDGAGRTRFFHRTAVAGAFESLREGQSVQFEPQDLPKGLRAMNVRPAGAAMSAAGQPPRERSGQTYGRGTQNARPDQYGQRGVPGGGARAGQQYGRRGAGSGGAGGGAGRSSGGRPAAGGTGWRSSLSPFRNDPPAAPPRRRPR